MAAIYLKRAARSAVSGSGRTRPTKTGTLLETEVGGEAREIVPAASRLSRPEGMAGHALIVDACLSACLPGERLDLAPERFDR